MMKLLITNYTLLFLTHPNRQFCSLIWQTGPKYVTEFEILFSAWFIDHRHKCGTEYNISLGSTYQRVVRVKNTYKYIC